METCVRNLSASESVFNGHINDADKRARQVMKDYFPEQLKVVEEVEKKGGGIMAIFQQEPLLETMAYVVLVTAFANE